MQGGATRRRVVSHFSTKIPLRRYFSGSAAVGYSLLFVSLLLTPYSPQVFRLFCLRLPWGAAHSRNPLATQHQPHAGAFQLCPCQATAYCSKEHQREHWKTHKLVCEARAAKAHAK